MIVRTNINSAVTSNVINRIYLLHNAFTCSHMSMMHIIALQYYNISMYSCTFSVEFVYKDPTNLQLV